jgi:hypothetical protein
VGPLEHAPAFQDLEVAANRDLGDAELLGQDRDADDPVFPKELLDATVTFRRKRLLHAWTNLPSRFG